MWMSPETDCAVTLPADTAWWFWSPLTVTIRASLYDSPTRTSPETALMFAVPPTKPIFTSPDAVFTVASPPTWSASTSPLALLTTRSCVTSRSSTSPEAVETTASRSGPRAVTSADFVRASRLDEAGQRTRHEIPWRPKKRPMPKARLLDGTSTTSWSPRRSTRAASTIACDSSSWATRSTSTRPSSVGSTTISPDGIRRSSETGPSVSNVFCISLLLTPGVAGEALAGALRMGAGLARAGDRPDEPRVRRDALAGGGVLDRGLQRLRQAEADARRKLLAGHARVPAGGVDVDELGLLAREPHLDVTRGKLRRQLDGGLREDVEELQAQVRAQELGEPARDGARALVAQLGGGLQIVLERLEDERQIHRDITMTSHVALVKQQR